MPSSFTRAVVAAWAVFAAASQAQSVHPADAGRAQFVARLAAVLELPRLDPDGVGAALGCAPGPVNKISEARREYPLASCAGVEAGEVIVGTDWAAVRLVPATSLRLAIQDLAPALLAYRYDVDIPTPHIGDAPILHVARHQFCVPAGMAVFDVALEGAARRDYRAAVKRAEAAWRPALPGKKPLRDAVASIVITSHCTVLSFMPTLRQQLEAKAK